MIMMNCPSWTEFKNVVVTKKSLLIQFSENPEFYEVYGVDGDFVWNYCLLRNAGADVVDFETNYKAKANQKIGSGEGNPYSIPTHRTKRSAIAAPVECPSEQTTEISFKLLEEMFITGGCLNVQNPKFGDYVTAEVKDLDGVIPAPFRPVLAENWPVCSTYIVKEFIEIYNENYSVLKIDTKPLAAKIAAGLYLTINYHAVASLVPRKVTVNYYLSKKL